MKATFYGNEDGTAVTQGEIPEEYRAIAEEYREKLVEAVAKLMKILWRNTSKVKKSLLKSLKRLSVKLHCQYNSIQLFVVQHSKTKVFN